MVGSTNTIIYEMYKELGMPINDETAHIMLAGIISDTRNLEKPTVQRVDTIAWEALTSQLGISSDSAAWINLQMEEAVYDYSGMTDEEIYISDYKEYNLDSYKVGIGCMADKENDIDNFINRMLAVSPDVMKEKGCDMLFAVIDKRVPNPDPAKAKFKPFILGGFYFIYYGEGTKDVAVSIFGPSLREGVIFVETNMPRGQIVNMIDEELW